MVVRTPRRRTADQSTAGSGADRTHDFEVLYDAVAQIRMKDIDAGVDDRCHPHPAAVERYALGIEIWTSRHGLLCETRTRRPRRCVDEVAKPAVGLEVDTLGSSLSARKPRTGPRAKATSTESKSETTASPRARAISLHSVAEVSAKWTNAASSDITVFDKHTRASRRHLWKAPR